MVLGRERFLALVSGDERKGVYFTVAAGRKGRGGSRKGGGRGVVG